MRERVARRLRHLSILLIAVVGLVLAGLAAETKLGGILLVPRALHRETQSPARRVTGSPARLVVGYAGIDYVDPSDNFTGCPNWTWLQAGCYTNTNLTSAHVSPQQMFTSDLAFVRRQHLGTFQRVWISLDQLMTWNSATGYAGYNSQALANVDDMLHRAAAADIKVSLVLFIYQPADHATNDFRPQALDGKRTSMRANYLQAVHDFVAHVAADPLEASTIEAMDLEAEGYYQLEAYFSNPANLGQWDYQEPSWPAVEQCYTIGNTLCTGGSAGHGCVTPRGGTDTRCTDVNILEPWFKDLYRRGKAAGPHFNFTISDTGRLLTTNASDQAHWISMYPVDVYDIHLYNGAPWDEIGRWASGRRLPKPWFAGEAGCTPGDVTCTYNRTTASQVDQWWLANMARYGARAVLLEDRHSVWTYADAGGAMAHILTPTGQELAGVNLATPGTGSKTIFSTSFDSQRIGPLQVGTVIDQFTAVSHRSGVVVEKTVVFSAPNALAVVLSSGSRSYAYKQYPKSYASHDLHFLFRLGRDVTLPGSAYVVLARTRPAGTSRQGKVDLVMAPGGILYLDCFTGTRARRYIWSSGEPLTRGAWYTLELRETVGISHGSLQLLLNGRQVAYTSGLNLGTRGISYFAVGDVSMPATPGTAGHLYFDDVATAS